MQTDREDGQVSLFDRAGCVGRTSPAPSAAEVPRARISASSSRKSSELKAIPFMSLDLTPGHGNLLGESYWEMVSPWLGGSSMLNTGPAPLSEEDVYSLSRILQDAPPRKYYLSRTACLGILRRARERGKELPPQLKAALTAQAGITPLTPPTPEVIVFAANQRDEVRDLHDVAGALGAQPGMKQQTFIADCLNPWDTQQARVFTPESKAPTLTGADGGGGRNPAGLLFAAGFCAGAGPSAGSVGYQEEIAPTLKAAASGNMMPSVLCLTDHGGQRMDLTTEMTPTLRAQMGAHLPLICLNDQGGGVMEFSEDVAGTLRAQEHGHQPLVCLNNQSGGVMECFAGASMGSPPQPSDSGCGGERRNSEMSEPCRLRQGEGYGACDDDGHQPLVFDNHGQDARFRGPVGIAQTVSASFGEGGNNQPLVVGARQEETPEEDMLSAIELFENHGIDARYTGPHKVSPTLTNRSGTGGNNLPLALQIQESICISGNATDHHAVYSRQRVDVFRDDDIASTESVHQSKDATDLVHQASAGPLLIRRLTPLECERLQGFPDFWTDLPGASDSARYRALGNSVAIPCVEYVMRGIAMAALPL